MTEWKTYKLGDIADIQTGPFGSQLHNKDYADEGSPIVTVEHLGNRHFTTQNLPLVSDTDKARLSKYILSEGDIVFSRVGSVDRCSYVSKAEDGWMFSGRCLRVRCSSKAYPLYVYYYFCLESIKQYIRNVAVGATMPSINTQIMSEIPISLPSLEEQRRIAGILGAIDDKIENNRRINTNFELQAQALYKQWFVDFEFPNEEGKPYKSSGGKMFDSELGQIPEGWSVGKLEDIGDIIGGGTPSKAVAEYYTKNGIAWITPKDLSVSHLKFTAKGETDITELGYKNSSAKIMPRGSVLFSSRAPIGYISIAKNDICTNQGFKSVIPHNGCTAFVYYFLLSNTENIESKATGSTFKEASGALMKSLELVIPSDDILEKFEKIMSPIFESQEKFEAENETLTTLRDTLLPKLMNGEI
ncbi:MAG: restriction endonuclease subunit S [Alistipes sp.]|nr:restriction endonuclease subunit S [Alistipes sp.]